MKTITTTLYSFSELSPEAQAKVLKKYRDWNTDHDWYRDTIDAFTKELEEEGYKSPDIKFSGFYSQGDGASFTCKSIDLTKFATQQNACLAPVIAEDGIAAYIDKTSLSYSHEKSVTLFVDWEHAEPPTQEQQEALGSLERTIEQDRLHWCKKIYRALEKEYESLTNDDCVAQSLEANELTFLEDGTRFNA